MRDSSPQLLLLCGPADEDVMVVDHVDTFMRIVESRWSEASFSGDQCGIAYWLQHPVQVMPRQVFDRASQALIDAEHPSSVSLDRMLDGTGFTAILPEDTDDLDSVLSDEDRDEFYKVRAVILVLGADETVEISVVEKHTGERITSTPILIDDLRELVVSRSAPVQ